eukprot:g5910.t1
MYSMEDAPYGHEGLASVSIKFVAKFSQQHGNENNPVGFLNIVFADEAHASLLSLTEDEETGDPVTRADVCCEQSNVFNGECQQVGHFNPGKAFETTDVSSLVHNIELKGSSPIEAHAKFHVEKSGQQLLALFYCPLGDTTAPVSLEGELSFINPYGYLSGKSFGFLPFYGAMAGLYILVMCSFIFLLLRYCSQVQPLQVCLFFLIVVGFLEVSLWFAIYLELNATGVRICCPLYPPAKVAVVVNALQRTIARSYVWKPSSSSHQYAYSFQLATSAEEADAYDINLSNLSVELPKDESAGVEMPVRSSAAVEEQDDQQVISLENQNETEV